MHTPASACSRSAHVHFSTRVRAGLRKHHRVTPNDIERRPSTLETGWLNQDVLRDL